MPSVNIILIYAIICAAGLYKVDNAEFDLESLLSDGSRFLSTHNLTTDDKCVLDCLRNSSIPRTVNKFLYSVVNDVFKRENSTNIRRIFNATMLDWYCGYANGRLECIAVCEDSSILKKEFLRLLRPTSYVCNETDFISNAKCYREVYEEDKDECESGDKCLQYKVSVIDHIYGKMKNVGKISWQESVQFVLNNLCQYIICGNQCRMNELSTKCGEESNQILMEFYRRVMASFKLIVIELHHWFMQGEELVITDICDQL